MSLSENVEYYIKIKGLSEYKLAILSGFSSQGKLSDLRSGRIKDIKLSTASKIAKALDITIDELYYGNNIDVNSPAGEIKKD